jgi:Fe-Mn family superoxide dismutase
MKYSAKKFNLNSLDGISKKTITEHLKLYKGYIKHFNKIQAVMQGEVAPDADPYTNKETIRRLGFEFGGIRNHEYYFGALEGGAQKISADSDLARKISNQFGSYKEWEKGFKKWIAGMRGVGWAMMGYDSNTDKLLNYWVDEQHIGHLTGVQPLVALDMWEHSYCMDYAPSEKKKYVDAYFRNLNWTVVSGWYDQLKFNI